MISQIKRIITISILVNGIGFNLWAQTPKDTLNTEVIEVVKPYVPTISDSFKITDQPPVTEEVVEKDSIQYQINSVPVASTFTPNKGKAKGVTKPVPEKLFDNYISIGFGNYTSPLLDAYVRTYPNRDAELGIILKHHSSQGGIKDVLLKDAYSDSKASIYYKQESNANIWKIGMDINHGIYNYYGLPETPVFTEAYLNEIDPKQSFLGIEINGEIDFTDFFVKSAKVQMSSFTDHFNSNEQRFRIQPVLEMPISSERINFRFDLDYLNGKFEKYYNSNDEIHYNYLHVGVEPNFEVLRDYLSINLGAKVYYMMDLKNGEGAFKAYPNVDASYMLIDEVLTIYGGATGGLTYNTYEDLTTENPFLSPNFYSVPTDEKYRFYAGMKGKLASNMSYLVSGAYSQIENQSLYLLNPTKTDGIIEVEQPYELGNSFGVIYDHTSLIALNGELSLDFSKEFTFGGNVSYKMYNFENVEEAYNLPALKTSIFADYHDKKWRGSAKLFMMSDRKDMEVPYGIMTFAPEDYTVSSGTFIDLNAEMSYTFTERLSAFAKANNLLTTHYKRYYNYPVQGLQVLAGITYKFDL